MRVADSSVIYAFFNAEDPHHPRARKAFEDSDTIWIPAEVFAESMALIARRVGSAAAQAAGDYLWSQPQTEIQPSGTDLLMAAWGEYAASRSRLSWADCIVVAACRELGADPLSFDKDLVKAARA